MGCGTPPLPTQYQGNSGKAFGGRIGRMGQLFPENVRIYFRVFVLDFRGREDQLQGVLEKRAAHPGNIAIQSAAAIAVNRFGIRFCMEPHNIFMVIRLIRHSRTL